MNFWKENSRDTVVVEKYDVIVCGGGPAGFTAAAAAARQGAKTLLIEKYGFLGGTGTAGLMVQFGSIYDGQKVLIGGCSHEFLHRLEDEGYAKMYSDKSHSMIFDPEGMIYICQEMILESGVNLMLHTMVVDVMLEHGCVKGVITENKSGRKAYEASVVIDATGDADIAYRAGAECRFGNEHGKVQPVSLEFIIGNVDHNKIIASRSKERLCSLIDEAMRNGDWKIPTKQFFSLGRVLKHGAPDNPENSFYFINATNALDIDGTNAEHLTRAEIECREQVYDILNFLKKYVFGFENSYLDRTAAQIGVRETRRIIGKYTLTQSDILSAKHFDDGVVPGRNSIDVHHVEGERFEHQYLKSGTHYQIPWRCFLPEKIEGLIVTGKCLSADHYALGSVRVMVVCMPMGEACGIAAAIACKENCPLDKINVESVKKKLRADGTII